MIIARAIISIHALVKRATTSWKAINAKCEISIHALVKRATIIAPNFAGCSSNFNPRPREEGDLKLRLLDGLTYISIHALVKRATRYFFQSIHAKRFQSTPS